MATKAQDVAYVARINRGGFSVAAAYLFIVLFVCAYTALTNDPGDVGYNWIPVILLAAPWGAWMPQLPLYVGFSLNVVCMYVLGFLLDELWCRIAATRLPR